MSSFPLKNIIVEGNMLSLKPFEVCPYSISCKFRKDAYMGICHGIKPDRARNFLCDLNEEGNAGNNREISSSTSKQEEKGC